MRNTSPKTAARADGLARYSAAAGVLAVALSVIARMLVAYIRATEVNNGHPEFDWPSFFAPAPGYMCAVVAIVLGIAALLHRDRARAWAVVGTTIGATFLVITLAEIPADMLARAVLEPGPR